MCEGSLRLPSAVRILRIGGDMFEGTALSSKVLDACASFMSVSVGVHKTARIDCCISEAHSRLTLAYSTVTGIPNIEYAFFTS